MSDRMGYVSADRLIGHFAPTRTEQVTTGTGVYYYAIPTGAALCGADVAGGGPARSAEFPRAYTVVQESWPIVEDCATCIAAAQRTEQSHDHEFRWVEGVHQCIDCGRAYDVNGTPIGRKP